MATSLVIGGLGTLAAALALVASDPPGDGVRAAPGAGLVFDLNTPAMAAIQHQAPMRDGTAMRYRLWSGDGPGAPLVVLVHGSGWHGEQFDRLGPDLAATGAVVVAPDLRGHGPAPDRRGDVDYIGQLEDDLADLIAHLRAPGQRVVALGHSSGGGLVLRFAGGAHGAALDAAVLLAPFLQHDAPTTRPASGGWADVRLRRVIGLTMLNAVGVRALNHLTVVQFRFPAAVLDGPLGHTATPAYSFRMMTGFNPRRDWRADVAALPPFLLVAGDRDEAFVAAAYEPTLAPVNGRGLYVIVPDVGHLAIVDDARTLQAIAGFLRSM